jgi:hypothetical protein
VNVDVSKITFAGAGGGLHVDFSDCALNAASVNNILHSVLQSEILEGGGGGSGDTLQLQGGTNAAPTGQGILDKATLATMGCTVTTN